MNERIQELVKQADIEFDVYSDNYGVDTATVTPYDLEKFAELIVRECANLTRWKEYDMSKEQRIRLEIYQEIKQHFGVEE
jgi:hypothetical protein